MTPEQLADGVLARDAAATGQPAAANEIRMAGTSIVSVALAQRSGIVNLRVIGNEQFVR